MRSYKAFAQFARVAVKGSETIADVLWAVINSEEHLIPGILSQDPLLKLEGIQGLIQSARQSMETEAGQIELLKVYASHRYDAGYRTDDVVLWRSWQKFCTESKPGPLPRRDDVPPAAYSKP